MNSKRSKTPIQAPSWRESNQFNLLIDGDSFFPAMLDAIRKASKYIFLEMYLVESGGITDRFIDEFIDAVQRGVPVFILLDDFGSWSLNNADRERMEVKGIHIALFNPLRYWKWRHNLHRNHRKLLIVDGMTAFTGGAGMCDQFSARDGKPGHWRETMIQISGPVIEDWEKSFIKLWRRWAKRDLGLTLTEKIPLSGDMPGRVSFLDKRKRQATIRSLITRVRSAEKRVWIMTAYFIPTWKIRRALARAARSGIDVRLILPGSHTDHPPARRISQTYYLRLLKNGVRIYEYKPRFLHAKVLLCDDWVSIGSTNLDRWSLRWNMEANQEINYEPFAREVSQMFQKDMEECEQITLQPWQGRSWRHRTIEFFWERLMVWTEYFLYTERIHLVTLSRTRKAKKRSKKEATDF